MKCPECTNEIKVNPEVIESGICPHCHEGILIPESEYPTTGKYSYKKYKCRRCGAIESHGTNHWGAIYPRCKSCSWKNPMEPMVTMDCLESIPNGYRKPEEWKTVRLGDLIESNEETKERELKEMNEQVIKFKEEYGESINGNFFIVDTIGVPHPYCIGSDHVCHASDHFNGILGSEAIESAEKQGIKCQVKGCNLSYREHEKALLVCCKEDLTIDNKTNPEIQDWIVSIKDKVESEKKYAGFAFIKYSEWIKSQE